MPRLNNFTYYGQHQFVNQTWVKSWAAWSELSPGDQWDLHTFYVARHSLSLEDLMAHRKQVTEKYPYLPQHAGRALKNLEVAYGAHMAAAQAKTERPTAWKPVKTKRQSKDRVIRVKSIAYPEPDMNKLIRTLLALAREMAAADRAKKLADETGDDVDHDSVD